MGTSRSPRQSSPRIPRGAARERLLEAAVKLIRTKGFAATSVEELCREAGVTKGAFFHHFSSKEVLGAATADYWSETTAVLFATAPYHALLDPLDRLLAYIDFRAELIDGPVEAYTCLAGTMVQEAYGASEAIRVACNASMTDHAATLEADIAEAMARYGAPENVTPHSLALHTQAVLQGGFILSKAGGKPECARDSAAHLKRYVQLLFKKENA